MDQRTNEAERLIQSNFVVVPYFREAKHNKDKEVETRAYTIKEINSISRYWDIDGNLGLNLFYSDVLLCVLLSHISASLRLTKYLFPIFKDGITLFFTR